MTHTLRNPIIERLTRKDIIEKYKSEEEYYKECMNYIDASSINIVFGRAGNYYDNRKKYNDIIERRDLVYYGVFDPYKSQFKDYNTDKRINNYDPILEIHHYDKITPKIDLLIGELLKRPFTFKATNKSDLVKVRRQETASQMIKELIIKQIKEEEPEIFAEDNTKLTSYQEIFSWIENNWLDMSESVANAILQYESEKLNLTDQYIKGFKESLCSGIEIYFVNNIDSNVFVESIDPLNFYTDMGDENPDIKESTIRKYEKTVSINYIVSYFYDKIDDSQYQKLLDLPGPLTTVHPLVHSNELTNNNNSVNTVTLQYYEWIDKRKIGILTTFDENGYPYETIVDEKYKKVEGEQIEWFWINEWRYAYRVNGDILLTYGILPNQNYSLDNFDCGYGSFSGFTNYYPLASKLMNLQHLYNYVMYKLKLLVHGNKGKKYIFDVSQIPHNWDLEKVNHFSDITNMILIDSSKSIDDRTSPFNQYTTIDTSIGGEIVQYVNYLNLLEDQISSISSITRERAGQSLASQTATSIERSVVQSNAGTELLFYNHYNNRRYVLSTLVDVVKIAYRNTKKVKYILNEGQQKYIEITDDNFKLNDYGIIISNNPKDYEELLQLKQIASQQYSNNAITFQELSKIIMSNSLSDIQKLMNDVELKRNQQIQEQQKREAEMQQQAFELERQSKQMDYEIKQKELQLKEEEIKIKQMEQDIKNKESDIKQQLADFEKEKFKMELELKKRERTD